MSTQLLRQRELRLRILRDDLRLPYKYVQLIRELKIIVTV